MSDLRCWYCGAEPVHVATITNFAGDVVRVEPVWPPADHDHALRPPSPGKLLAAGAAVADRSLEVWTE